MTEVINFGLANENHGFAFYIGDNLKDDINHIILKFTYDGKIIFGISIREKRITNSGKLVDNYDRAFEIGNLIAELTDAAKTSIQIEYAPSDDEEEFDKDIELWKNIDEKKRNK